MRSELRDLHQQLGATFILVTHDQIEAMSMATKVAVLDKGKVQQFGSPFEIYHQPQNLFVAAFVGQTKMNFFNCTYQEKGGNPCIQIGSTSIPLDAYTFGQKPQTGEEIILGIRPEDIYEAQTVPANDANFSLTLETTRRQLTGGDTNVGFEFEDEILRCRYKSARMPDIGTRQELVLDMSNCSVFNASTELRI